MHDLAVSKAGGIKSPGETPEVWASRTRLENRSGRGKNLAQRRRHQSRQAAENRLALLTLDQLRLAQQRQRLQSATPSHSRSINASEQLGNSRSVLLGVRNLGREQRKKFRLTLLRRASFQTVKKIAHNCSD
jgi:hypothetical protein